MKGLPKNVSNEHHHPIDSSKICTYPISKVFLGRAINLGQK
jgi:hypothetical protein